MSRSRSWSLSAPSSGILSRIAGFRPWLEVLGALLLLNLLVGAAWTYPRWRAVEPKRQETQQIAEAGELVRPALARARETYGCILTAEKDLKALRQSIATRSGTTAEAVEAIRRMVDDVGLEVSRVTRQAAPIDELGVLELQTKLPVTGSYASVRELISALGSEEGPFVAIDRIALSAPGESGAGGPLAVELGLSTFVVESKRSPPATSPGNGAGRNGSRVDTDGRAATLDDPWAVVARIRERLDSLQPLPASPASYRVSLERLHGRPPRPDSVSRNLFAFHSVAGPPPARIQAPPPEPATEPAPPAAPAPRVDFRLIGILQMADGYRATLKDSDGLYVVGAGEELPGDVEVVSVGVDHVELELRGARIRLTMEGGTP